MMPDIPFAARLAANHLWQSTWIACLCASLAWLLRSSEARLRHAVWLAASLKFLLPFAVLVGIGERMSFRHVFRATEAPILTTVIGIGQPFTGTNPEVYTRAAATAFPWFFWIGIVWAAGATGVLIAWMIRMHGVRVIVRKASQQESGREHEALGIARIAAGISRPIPLLISKDCMEPGVFGIFRPALLWPEGISAHLDDEQLAAILAHEVCHVRRSDNLLALLHMFVEAVFWFHPLVWWMGARLLEERERACDEAVLHMGSKPAQYADAILKACRFCVESPLTCVSGVSGSDLKRRMVRIMNAATIPLSRSRKMLLASIAVTAVASPIVIGALHPRVVTAQEPQEPSTAGLRFDSAALTPSSSGEKQFFVMRHDTELIDNNVTMKELIAMAYGVRPERITGGPQWIDTQRFDFEAQWTKRGATSELPPPPPGAQVIARTEAMGGPGPGPAPKMKMLMDPPVPVALQSMLRNFLAERLNLRVHDEPAVLPVYELVVANGGAKLTPSQHTPSDATWVKNMGRVQADASNGQQTFTITNGDLRVLGDNLSMQLGRDVVDKTGLTGRYDFQISLPAKADPDQLASSLRDQLGLDLQSTQQQMEVHTIDNIEMPQNN